MRSLVVALTLLLTTVLAGGALAQDRERAPGFKGPGKMASGPDRRVAEPARGDPRRPERMSPADRERLRRDIDDANRRMERGSRR